MIARPRIWNLSLSCGAVLARGAHTASLSCKTSTSPSDIHSFCITLPDMKPRHILFPTIHPLIQTNKTIPIIQNRTIIIEQAHEPSIQHLPIGWEFTHERPQSEGFNPLPRLLFPASKRPASMCRIMHSMQAALSRELWKRRYGRKYGGVERPVFPS